MTQDRLESIETHLAHLDKTVEELSDVVNKQQTQINRLARMIEMLFESEQKDAEIAADQRPPHW
ncbi:MAG: SlyX family protein [Paracoccaceae bacterium]